MTSVLVRRSDTEDDCVTVDKEDLKQMNRSELSQLCRYSGVRAHRGMKRNELIEILLKVQNGESVAVHNPIDSMRDKILTFFTFAKERLSNQLKSDCKDKTCYQHTDVQVMLCWLTNRKTIEKYL